MKVKIKKGIPNGTINAPSSKSYAHRYLIASLLSSSPCIIDNVDLNQDIMATLDCCKAYGSTFSLRESSIEVCDIAEVLKDKLSKCLEDGLWLDTDEVDRRPQKVREVVLYMALDDYC